MKHIKQNINNEDKTKKTIFKVKKDTSSIKQFKKKIQNNI